MARTIERVPELYPDQIVDLGMVREVYWHARFVFQGEAPEGEWHYYGTEPGPEHPTAIQHPATHLPAALYNLSEPDILYDVSIDAERTALQT